MIIYEELVYDYGTRYGVGAKVGNRRYAVSCRLKRHKRVMQRAVMKNKLKDVIKSSPRVIKQDKRDSPIRWRK